MKHHEAINVAHEISHGHGEPDCWVSPSILHAALNKATKDGSNYALSTYQSHCQALYVYGVAKSFTLACRLDS